jgi:tetratricopeptide (TPR) repeat protein
LLWRVFATREQRSRQSLWLPSDFTNLCIDQDGFLFATLLRSDNETVKRLNAKGQNIIKVPQEMKYPNGDLWFNESGFGIPTGPSQFIAVDTNAYGVYICLDSTRSRVFAYNEDHNLLFVFGGPGDREGYFRNPVDIGFVDDNILVLDSLAQSIEIFSPTLYGQALMNAVKSQYEYGYETAAEYWREALSYNHNLTLAYSGIGRMLLREGQFEKAMEYLKMGEDRTYYDKAYEKVRTAFLRQAFVPIACGVAGLAVLSAVIGSLKRRKLRKEESAL